MLLSFFLLFFLCESTVTLWTTIWTTNSYPETHSTTVTTEVMLSPLQLVATPDYPVAVGQQVNLHCTAFTIPNSVTWSLQHLKNQTWKEVGNGRDLTLTKPDQSGLYRCCAMTLSSGKHVSPNHTVYIISLHATVGEKIGIIAFVLSLLALIITLALLSWMGWQRLGHTLTISNTVAKGPGPEKSPKGALPKTDSDGDVYMNYTNQAYTDLDPTNMTGDNVYSSLS
ncbi:uncharacterized protein LOC127355252 [Dicentrarchus labrax]|uniref:uncharacterized protein LOC127355252 n=1 Tax=Dicentrarchus labrax TaxID=13489 RepID=UPI0021F602FA|nr:uncharacterized protein LOC127355252 [Dicentrarchus labrax]